MEEADPGGGNWLRDLALPYVAPFALFLGLLAIGEFLPFPIEWNYALRFGIVFALLIAVSRGVMPRRISHPLGSVVLGVGVFLLGVGPDVLWPAYRASWLFNNGLMGAPKASLPASVKGTRDLSDLSRAGQRGECADIGGAVLARMADALADFQRFPQSRTGGRQRNRSGS